MWVSGYLPSPPPSHEEKRDDEGETNILSCAIKWHLYNSCIYPTWKYSSIGLGTSIIWTTHDQSQTNFAKFCLSVRLKLSKKKNLKKNKQPPRVKIQGYYSKWIMSDLIPSSHKDLLGPRAKLQTAYTGEAKGATVVLGQEMARTSQMLCQALAGWSIAPCWVLNQAVQSWPRQPSLLWKRCSPKRQGRPLLVQFHRYETSAILLQSFSNEKVPCGLFNILAITRI